MNYFGRGVKDLYQGVKDFYSELNPATLTGAIDVIVVQQEDGSFKSSPFHVRFGKMALIKTKDLTVDIEINNKPVDLHMKLSEAGDAYFVDESQIDLTPNSPLPLMSTSIESLASEDREKSKSVIDLEQHHMSVSSETLSNQIEEEREKKPTVVKSVPIAIDTTPKTTKTTKLTKCMSTVETSLIDSPATPPKTNLASSIPTSRGLVFFSDGEITPEMTSPVVSRPTSPRSDYEIGIQVRMKRENLENSLLAAVKSSSPEPSSPTLSNGKKINRITRLSSSQIEQLNLHSGANEIIYSVTTALQGTTRITSYIFLWNYDEKVIVSDIDGTITKSDVWGQVLPIFGRDWTQAGVADLYSAIEKNQYKFIYLSARAIGQSRITRDLLKNVNQGGLTLPKGPLLVTPTSLLTAFQKEVIEKKPEEFKISCLQDVRFLFPPTHNPYHAGYGNKTSDVIAYKAVGIPVSRIFTINPQGELKHEVSRTFRSSYSNLCDFVDLIFPPLKPSAAIVKPEYDSFNFWRCTSYVNDDKLIAEIEQELKKI